MLKIIIVGMNLVSRIDALADLNINTSKYVLFILVIFSFLELADNTDVLPSDEELFYNKLIHWRNKFVNDLNCHTNPEQKDALQRVIDSIDGISELVKPI